MSWILGLPRHPIARIGCDKEGNPFDNSVIVMDEFHNVVKKTPYKANQPRLVGSCSHNE